jgi:ribosomal-protein-alanine N-acetyltransferase
VPAVHAIERAVFSDPWSERDFRECLAPPVLFLVADPEASTSEGVAGYVIAHHAADEGEILNLAVRPGHQRRGVGRELVKRVLATLHTRGVSHAFLEVRESNAAARSLYARAGFREVGRRPGYYRRPVEDAVILRAAISAAGGHA